MSMDISKSTVKLFVTNIAGSVLGFAGIAFFARRLTLGQLGVFFTFQAVLGLLSILSDLGFQGALVKRLSEGEDQSRYLSSAIVLILTLSVCTAVAVMLSSSYINTYIGAQLASFVAIAIIANESFKLATNTLRGELKVSETAGVQFINKIIFVGIGSALVMFDYGPQGLVLALVAGYLITSAIAILKISTPISAPSFEHAVSLFNYGKFSLVSFVEIYVYNWIDIAVIALLLTQADVSGYEMAWRVTVFVMLFTRAIESTILPQVSQWEAQAMKRRVEGLIPKAVAASLGVVIPAFLGGAIFSKEILTILFGEEYSFAWLVLIILLSGRMVEAIDGIFRTVLSGIDMPDLRAIAVTTGIIFNVILNLTLVWEFGIVGAAIATTTSYSISAVLTFYFIRRKINIKFPSYQVAWICIAGLIMAVLLSSLKMLFRINSLADLTAIILLGIIGYVASVMVYSPIRDPVLTEALRMVQDYR